MWPGGGWAQGLAHVPRAAWRGCGLRARHTMSVGVSSRRRNPNRGSCALKLNGSRCFELSRVAIGDLTQELRIAAALNAARARLSSPRRPLPFTALPPHRRLHPLRRRRRRPRLLRRLGDASPRLGRGRTCRASDRRASVAASVAAAAAAAATAAAPPPAPTTARFLTICAPPPTTSPTGRSGSTSGTSFIAAPSSSPSVAAAVAIVVGGGCCVCCAAACCCCCCCCCCSLCCSRTSPVCRRRSSSSISPISCSSLLYHSA